MITLKVEVTFDEDMLGTRNMDPKIHEEYIASKAPDADKAKEETESFDPEVEFEKSMTGFARNKQGEVCIFDYQWKGYFKDVFGMLKRLSNTECSKIKAYKKEIDGLLFVYPRLIPINMNGGSLDICQRPLRGQTAQGERIALASSEMVPSGSSMIFEIEMLLDSHEKAVLEALDYGKRRGFGQWRNSGMGRFHYRIIERKVS